jgi:four helix bundle protein
MIRSYRDLIVWQKAMRLVAGVYELTQKIPKGRDHGLGSQLRRAALSVASNIAEGHGRDHLRDYLRHLSIAKGSLSEVETQLLTARTVGAASAREIEPLLALTDEIGRMLTVLSRTLKAKLVRESPEAVPSLPPITKHREPDR